MAFVVCGRSSAGDDTLRNNSFTVENSASGISSQLTDTNGRRLCGIFPKGREPSIRTLRNWTKLRRIPYHRVGHFIYYDPSEVAAHISTRLRAPARGE